MEFRLGGCGLMKTSGVSEELVYFKLLVLPGGKKLTKQLASSKDTEVLPLHLSIGTACTNLAAYM